jgi:hypothetical protein
VLQRVHGAVWITYQPDLPEDQVKELADTVEGNPYGLLSPVPDQSSPIMLTAWGRQLPVDKADDKRVEQFVETYVSGPQTPERGAACLGSTATGTTPAGGSEMPQPSPTS